MTTSTSIPATKLLTGTIDIPRTLLNAPSIEVSDEEVAAALETALEASGGILALERDYWYCCPFNAIITFKFKYLSRQTNSVFYDEFKGQSIFDKYYTEMIAEDCPGLKAEPLGKAEAQFIIKHLQLSVKKNWY